MAKQSIFPGDRFKTNHCGWVTVIKYLHSTRVIVRFEDGYRVSCRADDLRHGAVKNPWHPRVFGVGYFGVGPFSWKTHPKEYALWTHMLQRCYDKKYHKVRPTYIGCTVAKRWHCFQTFAADIQMMVGYGRPKWQLDKDLLYKGNTNYSRVTCVFIPQELNSLLTKSDAGRGKYKIGVTYDKVMKKFKAQVSEGDGKSKNLGYFDTENEAHRVYVREKEKLFRKAARHWYGKISRRARRALMKLTVSEDD